jgi:ABC-type transporter Mla subunit MlaD
MATEANKLKVGAFLIAGFLLFNGALVWIGVSHVLEKTEPYVTYFDESVHGLDVGSLVKYRGVEVGRVGAMRVAPDGKLVEVAMDIAQGFRVAPGLRASLMGSGITGIIVVELSFPSPGSPPPPELSFTPPERYIPSQLSVMAGLTAAVTELAAGLRGAEIRGLVEDSRAAAVEVRRRLAAPEIDRMLAGVAGAAEGFETLARKATVLADDPRFTQLLDRLNAGAERLDGAARAAQGLLGDPRLAQILEDAKAAATTLRRSAEEIRGEIAALHAGERLDAVQQRVERTLDGVEAAAGSAAAATRETTAAASRAAARWERLGDNLDRSLQEALARLEQAAAKVEGLAASVEANPSRLLEKPPKEDFR